jgi:hypothetical protein
LCLALLGLKTILNEKDVMKVFTTNIYWTHFQKCHQKKKNKLIGECANKHLLNEIRLLEPELIIVLGSEPAKRVLNIDLDNKPVHYGNKFEFNKKCVEINYIATPFPKTGKEEQFIEVRKRLKKVIPDIIDDSPVSDSVKISSIDDLGKIMRHTGFEYRALEKLLKTYIDVKYDNILGNKSDVDIDAVWYARYVLPSSMAYSFVLICYSFIEQHIRETASYSGVELYDEEEKFRSINAILSDILEETNDYKRDEILYFKAVKNLRDLIIHYGGILNKDSKQKFDKVTKYFNNVEYNNTIHINFDDCNKILSNAKIIIDILNKACDH